MACVTRCLGSREYAQHIPPGTPLDDPGVSGARPALKLTGESLERNMAPTVVEQQQRQENRHPLLLNAPVSHGEFTQGMHKQALQSKQPGDCLLPGEPRPTREAPGRVHWASYWLK